MKKVLVSCLAFFALWQFSFASERVLEGKNANQFHPFAAKVRIIDQQVIPVYFEFKAENRIEMEQLFSFISESFEVPQDFGYQLISSELDDLGYTHLRYQQTFKTIPLDLSYLVVHTRNNKVVSFNGTISNRIPKVITASKKESTVLEVCLDDIAASVYKWQIVDEEKHLQRELNDPNATYYPKGELVFLNNELDINSEQLLCYKFNIYSHAPLSRFEYYVDANSGEIVYVENKIHSGNSPGRGISGYSDTVNIITDSVSNYFRLRETGRGNGVETYDLNNTTNYATAVDFIDSNNFWNAFNPVKNKYAIDAHWGTEVTYDYFLNIHNRNSIDNQGFLLRSYVHYGNNYVNAFWDGQRMTYGDGDATTSPLTTLDICGHEVAHGWTSRTSNLRYRSESGALNESFSDIWGVAIENYGRPNNWNWLIGEDIGRAFRSMSNPNQFGDPDTYGGLFWIDQNCTPTSANDWCGVHTNSGVQNYWFYLLSEGGIGVNDNADSFRVAGIGIVKAAKIAYRNNTNYLGINSNHNDARFYAIQSAVDLYGACSPEVESVTNAWYAVGVGLPFENGVNGEFDAVLDTLYCSAPATVEFNSNGSNVLTFNWNFGDGQTSSQADPIHSYAMPGVYNVRLIADGGTCGIDTVLKSSYIKVDTSFDCSIFLDGSSITTNDCKGTFYDIGGLNGNYTINSDDTLIISPTNADYVVLSFKSFQVELGDYNLCNKDYVEVYDGGFNDLLIGRYCSNNLPPDSIVSTSNQLTVLFHSDNKVVDGGFKGAWQCRSAIIRPVADFSISKDTSCNGALKFYDESIGGTNSWGWNFGDGNVSFERNPTHKYTSSGNYDVTLRVTNSIGNSFIRKSNAVVVNLPPSPVVTNDTVCFGGDAKLAASGSPSLDWYSNPISTNKLFTGDTLRLNNMTLDLDFYVESYQKGARVIGTPFIISGNGYFSNTSEEMYFDVHEPSIIESVILNSNRFGIRRIDLRNSKGEIIASKNVLASGTPTQVTLDFEVYPDTAYSLSIGSRDPDLYVNTTGASYPYPIGSMMSLTGSSLGNTAYPFFYYWIARPLDCVSERVNVFAKVDTSCVTVGVNEINQLRDLSLSPNPFKSTINLNNLPAYLSFNLRIFNINGAEIKRIDNMVSKGDRMQINLSNLSSGFYLIRIDSEQSTKSFKLIKTD